MYANEKATNYSTADDVAYLGCEVMLAEKREELWEDYVKAERFNVEKFRFSASGFMTWRSEEVSGTYADKFMAVIEQIFAEKHRDYAEAFFTCLSPAFLNREKDLESFKEILARAQKAENTHFTKMVTREIQKMEDQKVVLTKFAA